MFNSERKAFMVRPSRALRPIVEATRRRFAHSAAKAMEDR
jgi:hypothetical protein